VEIEEKIDAQAVLAEFDKESNNRHFKGVPQKAVRYMLAAFSVFAIWLNTFSTLPEQQRRAAFIGIVIFMAFVLFPARKKDLERANYIPWYDIILGIVGAGSFFYFIANYEAIIKRAGANTTLDIIIAIIGILILM